MPVVYYTKNKSKPLKAYIHVIKNRTKQLQGSLLHQDSLNIITLHNMKAILMFFFSKLPCQLLFIFTEHFTVFKNVSVGRWGYGGHEFFYLWSTPPPFNIDITQ